MVLKRFILILCLLLVVTFVSAQPPFQSTEIIFTGIQIEAPVIESIKLDETFKFHIHAHNATTGLLLRNDTTICNIHMYDIKGNHLIEDNMSFDSNNFDFEYEVLGDNFTETGQYAVLLYCEVPDEIGGFFEYAFDVTPSGLILKESEALIYFVALLLLLALLCFSLYGAIFIPFANTVDESEDGSVINVNTLKYLKVFLIVLTYILLFYMTSIIYSISSGFLMIDKLSFAFYYMWVMLYAGIWPCIIVSVLLLLIKFLQDKKIVDGLNRGDFFDINMGKR